jgi:hypothetical protein
MMRNVDINLDEIGYELTKKTAEIYMETGYALLALQELRALTQLKEETEKKQKPPTTFSMGRLFLSLGEDSAAGDSDIKVYT